MEGPSDPSSSSKAAGSSSSSAADADPDAALAKSEYLTREEVMRRRSRRLRRLAQCYRDHYWALMEQLRVRHRKFVWDYGASAYKAEDGAAEGRENGAMVPDHRNGNNGVDFGLDDRKLGLGLGLTGSAVQCAFPGCRARAMPLSTYCHLHILSDTKQQLYKPCKYPHKRVPGPILCGKPILKTMIPSLCPAHLQRAEKELIKDLKKNGIAAAASTKLASKFHLVITEYVRVIQTKRRAAVRKNKSNHPENNTAACSDLCMLRTRGSIRHSDRKIRAYPQLSQ